MSGGRKPSPSFPPPRPPGGRGEGGVSGRRMIFCSQAPREGMVILAASSAAVALGNKSSKTRESGVSDDADASPGTSILNILLSVLAPFVVIGAIVLAVTANKNSGKSKSRVIGMAIVAFLVPIEYLAQAIIRIFLHDYTWRKVDIEMTPAAGPS